MATSAIAVNTFGSRSNSRYGRIECGASLAAAG